MSVCERAYSVFVLSQTNKTLRQMITKWKQKNSALCWPEVPSEHIISNCCRHLDWWIRVEKRETNGIRPKWINDSQTSFALLYNWLALTLISMTIDFICTEYWFDAVSVIVCPIDFTSIFYLYSTNQTKWKEKQREREKKRSQIDLIGKVQRINWIWLTESQRMYTHTYATERERKEGKRDFNAYRPSHIHMLAFQTWLNGVPQFYVFNYGG